eukprot:scaffold1632_cov63-Phaeocystis_antarctica.AAC.4
MGGLVGLGQGWCRRWRELPRRDSRDGLLRPRRRPRRMLPHEDDDASHSSTPRLDATPQLALEAPGVGTERTKAVSSLVGDLSRALEDLMAKQKAQSKCIATIADLLQKTQETAAKSADWVVDLGQELENWQSDADQASTSTESAVKHLEPFVKENLAAASTRARAYEEAHASWKLIGAKKLEKKKADLQQKETDAALTKARCAMEVSAEQLRLMEEDYETTLLNAMRHMLHGQLTLHAKGIETFTEAMNELPETARLVPRLPRPEGNEN